MRKTTRRGLSLLEVLLALAILGMTLAVIGELVRLGGRNAEQARDLAMAQIHCESIMAQVVTGLIPPTALADAPLADPNAPDDWLYSVEVQPVDSGLLAVKVSVTQNPALFSRPIGFSLGRWMLDPTTTSATSGSTTGTTGTSTSGTSTGF